MLPNKGHVELMVVGLGGRGIQLLSQVLTDAARASYRHISCAANYAPVTRGGRSESTVVLSANEISSPVMRSPQGVIILSPGLLKEFEGRMLKGGLVILDSTVVTEKVERADLRVVPIPATKCAADLGNEQVANFVLLGAYLEATKALPPEAVEGALEKRLGSRGKALLDLNKRALKIGAGLVSGLAQEEHEGSRQ